MGLLMFVEPESAPAKTALKSDPTASARSTIRRQPTVRYQSHTRDHTMSSRQRGDGRSSVIDRSSLLDIIRRDHQRDWHPAREDETPHSAELYANVEAATQERTAASNRRRVRDGRALLRDALSYERPSQRMRQPRESALRFEVGTIAPSPFIGDGVATRRDFEESVAHRGYSRASQDGGYMPTPPYTSRDQSARSSLTSSTSPPGSAALTPRFPPAYYPDGPQAERESYVRSSRVRHPRRSYQYPSASSIRVTHPTGIDGTRDSTDGLGDRQRSVTPEINHWETLLTTITPDERLPTPDSSFTSANASFNAATFEPGTDAHRRSSQPDASAAHREARREMIRARIREGRSCDSDSDSDSGSSLATDPSVRRRVDRDAAAGRAPSHEPTSPLSSPPSAHDTASDGEDYIPLTRTSARTAPGAHPPSPRWSQLTAEDQRRLNRWEAQHAQELVSLADDERALAYHFLHHGDARLSDEALRLRQRELAQRRARLGGGPSLVDADGALGPPQHGFAPERAASDARSEAAQRRSAGLQGRLRTMRDIVERMERGEEVPDEWWADAGLRRGLGGDGEAVGAGGARGWERL